MSQPIRRTLLPARQAIGALALLLASCSSNNAPTGGGTGVPASITIVAGDGQTAAPGTALPVHPAVVVRDAAGNPVAGATVSFAVDSGGGSLSATAATTGSDGMATAGVWTLGPVEGRNTIKAATATLTPATIAATGVVAGVSFPTATVPSSGGSVTVATAGPLQGFEFDVPAGTFTTALQVTVSYSSNLTLPHIANMTVGSPMVTITSNGPGTAAKLYTLHIPATIGADEFPVIAVVDSTTGVLDVLSTVNYDATGVTAVGDVLDESQVVETAQRSNHRGATLRQGAQTRYAVYLTKTAQLHTVTVDTHFLPGVDDWEFAGDATPIFPGTEAGQVVSERYYFANQKSLTSGALWQRFEETPGVTVSDVAGIRWSAALSKEFDGLVQRNVASAKPYEASNPVAYDRNTIQTIVSSMIASGRPQIVVFADPTSNVYSTVLAYRWDGPAGILYTANPDFPGDAARSATWSSSGLGCTTFCLAVAGVNHLIGYQTQLDGEFPSVRDSTIDKALFPQGFISSYDPFIAGVPGLDTIFVANDTTRLWVECPGCAGSFPTTLPLKHGGSGIQTQRLYLEGAPGQWSMAAGGLSSNGFFFDVTQFPTATGNHFADFKLGFEGRAALTTSGPATTTGWLGWKPYRIIKFAPLLTDVASGVGVPVTFTLATSGGPALPADFTYLFKWGDGTANTSFATRPSTASHTFTTAGTFPVVLEMHHPGDNALVGTTTLLVDPAAGQGVAWQVVSASAPTVSLPFAGIGALPVDTAARDSVTQWIQNVQSAPASSVIFFASSGGCSAVALEQFPGAPNVTSQAPDADKVALGIAGGAPCFGTTALTGTAILGPIGTGTLVGSVNPARTDIVTVLGSINATMAGATLTGTFTVNVTYTTGLGTYTVPFHATQVLPDPAGLRARRARAGP